MHKKIDQYCAHFTSKIIEKGWIQLHDGRLKYMNQFRNLTLSQPVNIPQHSMDFCWVLLKILTRSMFF